MREALGTWGIGIDYEMSRRAYCWEILNAYGIEASAMRVREGMNGVECWAGFALSLHMHAISDSLSPLVEMLLMLLWSCDTELEAWCTNERLADIPVEVENVIEKVPSFGLVGPANVFFESIDGGLLNRQE